jgi:hypothetical protein
MSIFKESQMTEEVKNQAAAQPAEAPQQAAPELTINDLNALKTIIDVATQRGAFKAAEMESVGKIYNRLSVFLESVTPKPEGQ